VPSAASLPWSWYEPNRDAKLKLPLSTTDGFLPDFATSAITADMSTSLGAFTRGEGMSLPLQRHADNLKLRRGEAGPVACPEEDPLVRGNPEEFSCRGECEQQAWARLGAFRRQFYDAKGKLPPDIALGVLTEVRGGGCAGSYAA
jgi:hypothetical protein